MKKKVENLTRPELIDELRRHMLPKQYPRILKWETNHIRSLLKSYTEFYPTPKAEN